MSLNGKMPNNNWIHLWGTKTSVTISTPSPTGQWQSWQSTKWSSRLKEKTQNPQQPQPREDMTAELQGGHSSWWQWISLASPWYDIIPFIFFQSKCRLNFIMHCKVLSKCKLVTKTHWVILLIYVYCYIERILLLFCFWLFAHALSSVWNAFLIFRLEKAQPTRRKTFLGKLATTPEPPVTPMGSQSLLWPLLLLSPWHALI